MIVKSIDKIEVGDISAATLYRVFTGVWVHRDKWRDVLSPEQKLDFVTGLARSLSQEQTPSIHHKALAEYVERDLAVLIEDHRHLVEIDNEIRTASFLTRDEAGRYGFAHKSYREYFYACYLCRELAARRTQALADGILSPEVLGFLADMIGAEEVEAVEEVEGMLEGILVNSYQTRLSENALLCLYRIRRGAIEDASARSEFVVHMPEYAQLSGAQCDQFDLEGAILHGVDFSGASLREAILVRCEFNGGNFSSAELERANVCSTVFKSCQMSKC
ncbi:MAG: pentapeptide repeat-containing protein, partial [Planctomycetes bacterium]|nr:pentapeptide repeat-containing protein [Planctomycetota bacterium]